MHRILVIQIFFAALGFSATADFSTSIRPFVQKNCLGCHNDKAKVGGLSLAGYQTTADMLRGRDLWERVSERIKNGEMPPKGLPRPASSESVAVTRWIDGTFERIDRSTPPDPGRLTAHRLNRFEYNNAVQDLLGIDFKPADDFPNDDSGYGFDNIGDVLSLSPVLMEKYLAAAEKIAKRAIPTGALPKPTRDKVSNHHIPKYGPEPTSEYIRYQVANEADYTIRAGVSGKREPLLITLFVDNVAVKDAVFDNFDNERPRYIEFPMHLTAGEHRLGARLRRWWEVTELSPPPNLRFVNTEAKEVEPPPLTPRVDYVELQGPYHPLPAPPTEAQKRIFVCTEKTTACAETMLRPLAYHAWRRPITNAEIQKLASFVKLAEQSGDSFDEGMRLALEAILVSPNFLFRIESNTPVVRPVSDFELASRLSFFLWSSSPDAVLLHAAEEHTLHEPPVLKAQVARMLKDGKSARFVSSFAGQWLELRKEKMLTYALGRGLERYDRPAVKQIVAQLAANDYRFDDLVSGIVESLPFRMRRGEEHTTCYADNCTGAPSLGGWVPRSRYLSSTQCHPRLALRRRGRRPCGWPSPMSRTGLPWMHGRPRK